MPHKKIAIALPLDEVHISSLQDWSSRFDWSHVEEVHLIHVVRKNLTALEFGVMEVPDERTYQEMRPSLELNLRNEAQRIIPQDFSGTIHLHLTTDFNPELEVISTLKKLSVSLVVVASRGHHGWNTLFHSSFTKQILKGAPCDVYVVHPQAA